MKKLWIWITVGVVAVVGAGIGIAYAMGLFDKKKDNDTDPTPVAVTEVSINGASAIAVNTATTYTAVVLPADATVKTVTWAVTNGATITSGGVLTATETGDVTITATSNNGKVGSKTITVCADQGTADVAIAKAAIEGTTFIAPQADAMGMGAANSFIQNIIDGLLPNGVTADIMEGTFNAAIAGTVSSPNGTDGSYTFTVTLNTGLATEQNTITLTLTITATNITAQNNADITAAKGIVENTNYAATQTAVTDAETANTAVQSVLGGLQLNGVTTAIVDGTFTAATAGTSANTIGTNGSFTFTVKLNKGSGTEQTTGTLTLDIIATPFDDAARIAAAKTAIEDILDNAEYSAATCDTNQHTREYIEGLLSTVGGLNAEGGLYGVGYNVNVQPFTPAVAGTVQNAAGTDGSAGIEVAITCGSGAPEFVTRTKTIVTTTIFTDDDTIEDAREKLTIALPSTLIASASNNSQTAMHNFVNSECDIVKNSHTVVISIANEGFKTATKGTMPEIGDDLNSHIGIDGEYTCLITISKNDGTPRELEVTIVITTDDYVTQGLAFDPITEDSEVIGYEVRQGTMDSSAATIVIPAEYNNLPVLRIANNGFSNGLTLVKLVIIPDGVQEIDVAAFMGCTALASVTLPESVKSIGGMAFRDVGGPLTLTIANKGIEFRMGNVFQNSKLEIYFNGTQNEFEALVIHTAGAPTTTTVHSTLPEKTKVYFKDYPNDPTAFAIYNQQP